MHEPGDGCNERGFVMKATRLTASIATGVLVGSIVLTTPADALRCGDRPDGEVEFPGPNDTWDSPGEVISFLNRSGVRSNTFEAPPGQLVKLICAGAP